MDAQSSDKVVTAVTARPDKVRASVVVPTRNNLSCLSQCIEVLHKTLTPADEIIIVLNGSEQENRTAKAFASVIVQDAPVWTFVVDICPDGGFCVACNAGMKAARGQYIVLLRISPGSSRMPKIRRWQNR
jgi:glycosyltransferase involved in cell wall biosynthesis